MQDEGCRKRMNKKGTKRDDRENKTLNGARIIPSVPSELSY